MRSGFDLYVIHSPRLVERRAVLSGALSRAGWQAQWITAPDPGARDILARLRHRAHPRVTRSELSVYLKHLEALRRIARGVAERALVLEDDALLPDDPAAALAPYLEALPPQTDAAFLGASSDLHALPFDAGARFGPGLRTRSMSAVLVTRAAAAAILARLDGRPIAQAIDIAVDDVIRDVPLHCVWSVPPIVGNGSESGRYPRAIVHATWRQYSWVRTLRRRLPGKAAV